MDGTYQPFENCLKLNEAQAFCDVSRTLSLYQPLTVFLGFPGKVADLETWLPLLPSVSCTCPHVICVKIVFPRSITLILFSIGIHSDLDLMLVVLTLQTVGADLGDLADRASKRPLASRRGIPPCPRRSSCGFGLLIGQKQVEGALQVTTWRPN